MVKWRLRRSDCRGTPDDREKIKLRSLATSSRRRR